MKVAIAGYGQEGVANYKYWLAKGNEVVILDEKQPALAVPDGAEVRVGSQIFSSLEGFDLVVRTASLNPEKIHTTAKVWSATNEFFKQCPAPIIGVTGTKGKGTTASLIAAILTKAGLHTHLLGNIGVPALEQLPSISADDIVVFELSSFQLWDLERSPETAVVLMIEPDHQDIHASMAEYIEAKSMIGAHQNASDLLVYHPNNTFSSEVAAKSNAQKRRYMTPEGAYIKKSQILIEENVVCGVKEVGLIGQHNLENVCAAVTAAWNYTQDMLAIKAAVTTFKGLEHRLEFVRELGGVEYYNDSYSSAPGATIAAARSFQNPEILICGGFDRGLDFTSLAESLSERKNLKKVVLIGATRHKIAAALQAANITDYDVLDTTNLNRVVLHCQSIAQPEDIVVLSPGCPSFDMFSNFHERGEQFKAIVKRLQ